jgi:SprT-like protein
MPEPADDPGLHALADRLSRKWFHAPFDGRAVWAERLRYRAGEFRPHDGTIRISRPYHDRYGLGVTEGILLHELCHWWLHRAGIAHRENAAVFQDLLRRTGAPRRAPAPPGLPCRTYLYRCPACGRRYLYRRRVSGYACGECCRRHAGGRFDPRFLLRAEATA